MKKSRLLTLFFLLAFTVTLSAAVWQTQRARYKYALEQELAQTQQRAPQRLSDLLRDPYFQPYYQTVTVKGHFLPNNTILLENKFYQHRVGVEVVSPFRVEATGQILLVNRGWLEKKQVDITSFQNMPKTDIELTGMIDKIRSNPFILSRHELGLTTWPAKQLQLRPAVIASALNTQVYPFQLRLASRHPNAYITAWQPVIMPWQKHVGYAVQWLLLAVTSLVMVLINRRSTIL